MRRGVQTFAVVEEALSIKVAVDDDGLWGEAGARRSWDVGGDRLGGSKARAGGDEKSCGLHIGGEDIVLLMTGGLE